MLRYVFWVDFVVKILQRANTDNNSQLFWIIQSSQSELSDSFVRYNHVDTSLRLFFDFSIPVTNIPHVELFSSSYKAP